MTIKTLTAATLAATLSTAAFAQSVSTSTDVDTGAAGAGAQTSTDAGSTLNTTANTNAAGVDATSNANASASGMSHGNLISDLKNGTANSAEWSAQIAGIGEDATITVVPLSELKGEGAENSAALESEMDKVRSDAEMAQTAIENNAHVREALEAQSYSASDVVAVDVEGTSSVTLIVKDGS